MSHSYLGDVFSLWHFQAAVQLLTITCAELRRSHTVGELQLNGSNRVVNSTSHSLQVSAFELLHRGVVLQECRQVGGEFEILLPSVLSANIQLA